MSARTVQYRNTTAAGIYPVEVFTRDDKTECELVALTQKLFFDRTRPESRSVLLAGVEEGESPTLWVAQGVAAVLSRLLGRHVYLLSGSGPPSPNVPSDLQDSAAGSSAVILEHLKSPDTESSQAQFPERLATLVAQGEYVIVHLANVSRSADILSQMPVLDGIALLVQASKTRQATLRAVERMVLSTPLPILGIVLLNRTYPIPEKLYRLL